MKTLYLIRHAKAEPHSLSKKDQDRALAPKAHQQMERLKPLLKDKGFAAEKVLCSFARRTRETCMLLKDAGFYGAAAVVFEASLYHASPQTMLDILSGETAASIALIGHNPGIYQLAFHLARHDASLAAGYPTFSVTKFICQVESWAELSPATTTLQFFVRP